MLLPCSEVSAITLTSFRSFVKEKLVRDNQIKSKLYNSSFSLSAVVPWNIYTPQSKQSKTGEVIHPIVRTIELPCDG